MRLAGVIAIVLVSVLGLLIAARGASLSRPGGAEAVAAPDADREAPPEAGAGGVAPSSAPSPAGTIAPSPERSTIVSATPAPSPSQQTDDQDLLALLSSAADKVDAIRDAIRDNDANTLLRYQHDLLQDIQGARELAKQDNTREGKEVRDALDQVEGGLSGDLVKLDDAARGLHDATTALAEARGVSLAPRPRRVADLQRYAQDAALKVANFQKAYDASDASRLLRLQRDLLQMAEDGLSSLRNSHSPEADQVKSALEDVQAALPGDLERLDAARMKLLDVAGERSRPSPSPRAAPASPAPASPAAGSQPFSEAADLVPVVNSLGQRLSAVRTAVDEGNQEGADEARAALAEEVQRVQSRLPGADFAEAERLSRALTPLSKVGSGDDQQIEPASEALSDVVGR